MQDERVMQLFGLVNTMLANDRATAERDLSIARYAVIPLSPNSGLIGWVPNTDTLHALIREYRDARKVCCSARRPHPPPPQRSTAGVSIGVPLPRGCMRVPDHARSGC